MDLKRIIANVVTTVIAIYLFGYWARHVEHELSIFKLELFKGWIGVTLGIVILILFSLLILFIIWLWDKGGDKK